MEERHKSPNGVDNLLLQALLASDRALLEKGGEIVSLELEAAIMRPGDPLEALYFPISAIFSLEEPVGTAGRAEVAVIGREGMVGWPALLGARHATHSAVVRLRAGTALRVPITAVEEALRVSATLGTALLRFVHVVIVHMARAIASHLHDPVEMRIARWLLMRHDRVGGDVLLIHHEAIADSLNIRRASVTDRLHVLEGERFVRCSRGKIVIRDRGRLEDFAGASYGIVEAQYRAMIAPFGKSSPRIAEAAPDVIVGTLAMTGAA